ncbi:hypothetical protein JOF53_002984 [Crossiella equi]|uniref:DUF4034 domain-containing protein n=1 Tax=Crossiella equi TaxID=130796 RepID=A0ABS5AC03_9PSEU|nr:hypothetical protein [Crossiella equi]MBP2474112.1 hypothetical protein [Crossiella equi]
MPKIFPWRRPTTLPEPRVGLTYGSPELEAVRCAARTGDRAGLGALLAAAQDSDDRSDAVLVAATTVVEQHGTTVPRWLLEWVTSTPGDALAWTVRGAVEVLRAWELRGYHRTRGDGLGFGQVLASAEVMCTRAAELDPRDPTPWVWLVHMARGQGIGALNTARRWAEVVRRAPQHLRGHEQMLTSLSPKWGTSVQVMSDFVQDAVSVAPAGSALHLLVPRGYVEQWVDLSPAQQRRFLNRVDVWDHAQQAIDRWLHPHGTDPRARISGHNLVAFWYSLWGTHHLARPHFEATRGHVDRYPWSYLRADFLRAFTKHRDRSGLV